MSPDPPAIVSLVDGEPVASLDVTDSSVLRGDGCFEAIRSYSGHLFRAGDHLDRLERSARALDLTMPARSVLDGWMAQVSAGRGDCVVRVVLTRGPAVPGVTSGGRCIVLSHPLPPVPAEVRLLPVAAPWHPAGRQWDLAGVKTISYAPNQAASRAAHQAGFDDALLLGDDGTVLEGPTFTIAWAVDGVVYTPGLGLGILESVTRRVMLEMVEVREVTAPLTVVLNADEVFSLSTLKEATPVVAIGETAFAPGPVTQDLAQRVGLAARSAATH